MRIVVYSKTYFPSVGGVETTSRILAKVLVRLGHNVTVVTSTPPPPDGELAEGYEIVRSAGFADCFAATRSADVMISKGGVSAAAGLAAMVRRRPLILWHEMYGPVLAGSRRGHLVPGMALRQVVVQYAVFHVAVSEACLRSKGLPAGRRVSVIYNPISPWLADAAANIRGAGRTAERSRYDVLFVGRLIRSKGIFVLAEALKRLYAQGVHPRVCFVGDGPEGAELKQALRDCGHERVVFTGALESQELAEVFGRSRCLVLPALQPEGMGMVFAEAFAFGLPVIGSDQPGMDEIIGDAGLLSPTGDAEVLAERIKRLVVREPETYSVLAGKALRRSERFSHGEYVRRVQEVLAVTPARETSE